MHTEMPDGQFALPPVFAQTMAGNENFDGAQVGACARASWEPAEDVTVLAMTISTCEFNTATNGGDRLRRPTALPAQPVPLRRVRRSTSATRRTWPRGTRRAARIRPGRNGTDRGQRPGSTATDRASSRCPTTARSRGPNPLIVAQPSRPTAGTGSARRSPIARSSTFRSTMRETQACTATDYRVVSVAPVVFTGFHLGSAEPADDAPRGCGPGRRLPCNSDRSDRCVVGRLRGRGDPDRRTSTATRL